MAKKKAAAEAEVSSSTDDVVQRMLDKINKEYGQGIASSGSDVAKRPRMKVPVSPAIDAITNGGFKEGSFIGLSGAEGLGKTIAALSFAETCQQEKWGSRPIFFCDIECRINEEYLISGFEHLKIDKPHFNIIGNEEGKILTAQDYLQIAYDIVKNVPGCVLILDSISSLISEKELQGGVGTETRGATAKLFSGWLELAKGAVRANRCFVIGTTHLIADSGGGGALLEKASRNWGHMCNYKLRVGRPFSPGEKFDWYLGDKDSGKKIGIRPNWKMLKCNNTGSPFCAARTGYLRFGVGIDRLMEAADLGADLGIITKGGAWYTLSYMTNILGCSEKETPKACGLEATRTLLRDNPQYVEPLMALIAERISSASNDADEEEE